MLSCKQASLLVSRSCEKKLSLSERVNLRIHLMICDACTCFRVQLGQLHAGMQSLIDGVEQNTHLKLSTAAKARINHAIKTSKH
jgi:hypothetical protein